MNRFIVVFLLIFIVSIPTKGISSPIQEGYIDSILQLDFSELSSDLYQSKQIFEKAAELSKAGNNEIQLAKLYNKLGIIHHMLDKPEASQDYFNRAILLFEKNKDEIGAGNVYAEMGNSMRRRDIQKAKAYMEEGIGLLEKNNAKELQSAYDNYGVMFHHQGKIDSAMLFYQRSLQLKRKYGDSIGVPYSMQKIAMVNSSEGEFEKAFQTLDKALEISKSLRDSLLICETLTYYGDVHMAEKNFQKSAQYFEAALKIAQHKNYNYLITYIYGELPEVYHALGEKDKAFEFLKESKLMRDSALNYERVRSIAELELFFETTQKEQKIKLLEQDVEIKSLKTLQQKRVIIGIILFLILITALLSLFMNRQKLKHKTALLEQKEQSQKERLTSIIIGEEKERERVARELHDGLGQLLSAAKMHVSSLEEDIESELKPYLQNSIQLVDQACVEVREISHALLPKRLSSGQLESALTELQTSINSSNKIDFKFDQTADLSTIKDQKAVAVYRIIQELVNNTIKHAKANEIELKIEKLNDLFVIRYSDNGKHFKPNMIETGKGIGWLNIFSRVEMIEGTINIQSVNGGFNAVIKF